MVREVLTGAGNLRVKSRLSLRRFSAVHSHGSRHLAGVLYKKSRRGAWQERYFRVNGHYLVYSKALGGDILGGVDLAGPDSQLELFTVRQHGSEATVLRVAGIDCDSSSRAAKPERRVLELQCRHFAGGPGTIRDWHRELSAAIAEFAPSPAAIDEQGGVAHEGTGTRTTPASSGEAHVRVAERVSGNPMRLPPIAMKLAWAAAGATARALARSDERGCAPPAAGAAASANAQLNDAAGASGRSDAAHAIASIDTSGTNAPATAPAHAPLPHASEAAQRKEDLARGIFRGLVPTRPRARRVLGQVEVALHELRALALDAPLFATLVAKHRTQHRSKNGDGDPAVPLVVWADISFETQTARTAHRRVDLAVVSFDRPRAIGETRDQRTVSAKREVVTRVAWGDGPVARRSDNDAAGAVGGVIGKRCGRDAFVATFDVTDITADVRVVFHARRYELERKRKATPPKLVEKGPSVQVGAVMIPMAQLLNDDAAGVLRRGGAVHRFAAWDAAAEDGDAGAAAAAAAAGGGGGATQCDATCRPRWFRLFPVTAPYQAKFVRGSHEKASAHDDDAVSSELYEKDKWWRLNPPRQYLRGGVFETNRDELALDTARRKLVDEKRVRPGATAQKEEEEQGSARNFFTGVEGGAHCDAERGIGDELASAAERELRENLPHFSRAAMCGDNCGVCCITVRLRLACSPLEAYFLNAPSVGALHPPHSGKMTSTRYPVSELQARTALLATNLQHSFPPVTLLKRALGWRDTHASVIVALLWLYIWHVAPWTQYPMLCAGIFAWSMLEQRRAHVEEAAEREARDPIAIATAEWASAHAAGEVQVWEGPESSSFTGLSGRSREAATWPSDLRGSPTLLALHRDAPEMDVWLITDVTSGAATGAIDKLTEKVKALSRSTLGAAKQFGSKYVAVTMRQRCPSCACVSSLACRLRCRATPMAARTQ